MMTKTKKLTNFRYKPMEIEFGIEICVQIQIVAMISMESGNNFETKNVD